MLSTAVGVLPCMHNTHILACASMHPAEQRKHLPAGAMQRAADRHDYNDMNILQP